MDHLISVAKLTEHRIAFYVSQVLEVLDYLHNCGIVHLDIKVSIYNYQHSLIEWI